MIILKFGYFQNLHFFLSLSRPQTRFGSNVVFIFQKSLNVWKDMYMSGSQACRGSPDGLIEKQMCNLKAEKTKSFWMFTEPNTISLFCLLMYMYFLFILLPHFVLIMYVPIL